MVLTSTPAPASEVASASPRRRVKFWTISLVKTIELAANPSRLNRIYPRYQVQIGPPARPSNAVPSAQPAMPGKAMARAL